jgi:uncharacterized DUF497 family protein
MRVIRLRSNDSYFRGASADRRLVAVMFVDRDDAVRIISARQATRRERRDYEEASS